MNKNCIPTPLVATESIIYGVQDDLMSPYFINEITLVLINI